MGAKRDKQIREVTEKRGVPAALQTSGSTEWYTPVRYIDAVRELMGGIDVDPASNARANEVIQAAIYYDAVTNGLDKPWPGRVWLNPPYGYDGPKCNQARWSARLIEQYQAGITTEAVLLVNAATEAKWFWPLWDYPICFTDHRIHFYNAEGTGSQPAHGSALVYLGMQERRFLQIFQQFGFVVKRIPVKSMPTLWDWKAS